jgi:DNA-directed RNA polymerase subunit RPC12/RpoP
MKIQKYEIYLKPLDDHKCPDCGERVERRRRHLWQRAVSFALPLRNYQCTRCYRRFFAFSPLWKQMKPAEKILRVLATGVVLLASTYIILRIIFALFSTIMT